MRIRSAGNGRIRLRSADAHSALESVRRGPTASSSRESNGSIVERRRQGGEGRARRHERLMPNPRAGADRASDYQGPFGGKITLVT
jgi:hypothetical protein